MNTAKTILDQLGGNKFVAMTGAKNFLDGGDVLTFKIGRNASRANYVKVQLDPTDTYTVSFIQIRGTTCNILKEQDLIYADSLRPVFENFTGLRTSL